MGISGKRGQSQTEKRVRDLEAPETRDPREKTLLPPKLPRKPQCQDPGLSVQYVKKRPTA